MILTKITNFFLLFSNDIVIITLLVLGLIWLNRIIFHHAVCILLISMLYSATLKLFFQVSSPLYGYVFPSGHMLATTALYGWLTINYKNKILYLMASIILIGVATSLVYKGYHETYHVIGGFISAAILLFIYCFLFKKNAGALDVLNIIFANLALFLYLFKSRKNSPSCMASLLCA